MGTTWNKATPRNQNRFRHVTRDARCALVLTPHFVSPMERRGKKEKKRKERRKKTEPGPRTLRACDLRTPSNTDKACATMEAGSPTLLGRRMVLPWGSTKEPQGNGGDEVSVGNGTQILGETTFERRKKKKPSKRPRGGGPQKHTATPNKPQKQ